MHIEVGSTWHRMSVYGHRRIIVRSVELNHVLVEFVDVRCPYGGNHREWIERAYFTNSQSLHTVVYPRVPP